MPSVEQLVPLICDRCLVHTVALMPSAYNQQFLCLDCERFEYHKRGLPDDLIKAVKKRKPKGGKG